MVTVTGVVPSVYVKVNGAVPPKLNVTSGNVPPAQIVPPPETVAVGLALTITLTGVPKLVATQLLLSVNEVMVYVPAAALVMVKLAKG